MQETTAKRVVMVEADHHLATTISTVLTRAGYRCQRVADAAALRQCVSNTRPDLIMIDGDARGTDAHAMCQAIRRTHSADAVKILLLNGSGRSIDRRRYRALGADAVLAKPFGLEELRAEMTRLLSDRPLETA